MSMENSKLIGFIGKEEYDTVLYLSKILTMSGLRILCIDHSEKKGLKDCIGAIEGLNTKEQYQEYQGFDFTEKELQKIDLGKYHYVFVYYGQSNPKTDECDKYIYSTDAQLHNVRRISNCIIKEKTLQVILKDVSDICVTTDKIFKMIGELEIEQTYVIPYDMVAVRNKTIFQYKFNEFPSMKKLDSEYVTYLIQTTMMFNAEVSEKRIQQIIKNGR